jgi:hypothetical protein
LIVRVGEPGTGFYDELGRAMDLKGKVEVEEYWIGGWIRKMGECVQ